MNFSNDLFRVWFKRATVCSSIPIFFILLLSILLLVSCKTTRSTVSLYEAKQISVQFSDSSFVPPPKSIDDLRTIIDLYSSEQEIGTCESGPLRPLEDISKSLQNAPPYPNPMSKANRLNRIAYFGMYKGNYSRSIKSQKMAINALPIQKKATRGNWFAKLSTMYAYSGDFDSAQKALNRASGLYGQSNYEGSWKYYHLNRARAEIAQLKGNLSRAEQYFNKAITSLNELYFTRTGEVEILHADLAENLMLQGRLIESEILIRELITGSRFGMGIKYADGKILLVLAKSLYEQARYNEAEYAARAAVNAFLSFDPDCSTVFLNIARQTVARSLMAQERWEMAVAEFDAIREEMKEDPETFKTRFAGNVDWAVSLLVTGRAGKAADILQLGLGRTEKLLGDNHYRTAEIRCLIAITYAMKGDRERALKEFMNAIPHLLSQSRTDSEDLPQTSKNQRLIFILERYMRLLFNIHKTDIEAKAGINAQADAFLLADIARDRSVLQALGASSSRIALKDPELSDLARREQDAQKQIGALYGVLVNAMSKHVTDRDPKVIESLHSQIDKLRSARTVLIKEIEGRFPEYVQLINPKPLKLELVRNSLLPGEALVSIYTGRDISFVWAVPYQGKAAFASIPISRKDVKEMVEKVRYALEPDAKTLGEVPEFDLDTAYAIYQTFLKPVRKGWKNAESLLIIPHGALGYLPLSLLPTKPTKLAAEKKILLSKYQDVPWLVRSHAVTVLPSVSSLAALRALPPSDFDRRAFVGFGDPYFSEQQARAASKKKEKVQIASTKNFSDYSLRGISIERVKTNQLDSADIAILPRLPETADEIRSIALAVDADLTKDIFTGTQANEHQVKTMDLSTYKVVAFATHGLAPGDLNGLLQPALALSSPKVAGIEGDGLLTMGEILGLRLNADWVVLSACNTGAGREKGAEALSGLGRAFFYAGTRALLVSNWPVETTSAKELTTDLFKRQSENPSLTRAAALRQSMLSLIDGEGYVDQATGKIVFSYAHPIFWAPFTLVGD